MGFLENIVKDAVKVLAKKAGNEVAAAKQAVGANEALAKQTEAAPSAPVELQTVGLNCPVIAGSVEGTSTIYDADKDIEYEINQYFQVAPNFFEFDSGAGEVDVVFGYAPGKTEETFGGWEENMGYIAIVFENRAYEIVESYLKRGKLPAGTTLQKVDHPVMKYKSTFNRDNGHYVSYHFYRFDDVIHTHVSAFIPQALKGTAGEQEILAALDLMAATYREDRKREN